MKYQTINFFSIQRYTNNTEVLSELTIKKVVLCERILTFVKFLNFNDYTIIKPIELDTHMYSIKAIQVLNDRIKYTDKSISIKAYDTNYDKFNEQIKANLEKSTYLTFENLKNVDIEILKHVFESLKKEIT